jgi:hypothetical protein
MCDCKSYNGFNGTHDGAAEIVLQKPAWSDKENGICVDACIAEAIKMLWQNNVVTMGCCCGHNKINPNVVISESEDPRRVLELLDENDGRNWIVNQWKLASHSLRWTKLDC